MPGHAAASWMPMIETLSWAGAVLTAAIGAVSFILGQAKARRQRSEEIAERRVANAAAAREFQWRQAGAAQTSLEKMEEDPLAADAMLMLDWSGRSFPSGKEKWRLSKADVLRALRMPDDPFSEAETYVRDAFDRLFWHFERIQSQIEVELIALRHVRFPLAYWVALIDEDRQVFDRFLTAYGYDGALQLMEGLRRKGLPRVAPKYEDLLGKGGRAAVASSRRGGRNKASASPSKRRASPPLPSPVPPRG